MTKTIPLPKNFNEILPPHTDVATINNVIDVFADHEAFGERRAAIRKMITPIFEKHLSHKDVHKMAAKTDRDIRATRTGIRDMMKFNLLVNILLGQVSIGSVVEAVTEGYEYKTSGGNKVFGMHKAYSLEEFDLNMQWVEKMAAEGQYYDPVVEGGSSTIVKVDVSAITSMSHASNVLNYAAQKLGNYDDAIAAAAVCTTDPKVFDGSINLFLVAASKTDVAELEAPEEEVVVLGDLKKVADHIVATARALAKGEVESDAIISEAVKEVYPRPDSTSQKLIDLALGSSGLPSIDVLLNQIDKQSASIEELNKKISMASMAVASVEIEAASSGEIPAGKTETRLAADIFPVSKAHKKHLNFDVPFFVWEGKHPHVPSVDENYIWRIDELVTALHALVTNAKAWAYGHTGTGKSTLWEQIAAHLNWPMIRVNYDSEITRMDLIGRDTLIEEGGVTKSKFVDGILPTALSGPYMLVNDEVDFVRSDVAYVLQRALEDNGLLITEDGGRVVLQHPLCRIVATGNTQGQGDEFGMYQGARVQSTAFLDRFTSWLQVDYLTEKEESQLIAKACPGIENDLLGKMTQYVREHRKAFVSGEVMLPLSPRGSIALAKKCIAYMGIYPDQKTALSKASESTILNRAVTQDRVVLSGIMQRIFV